MRCGETLNRKLSIRDKVLSSYQQHHEKPDHCIFENKSAGQLPSHCTADQHICFAT